MNVIDLRVDSTPVAIVDIETTGLYPGADRLVEVSVVRAEPGEDPVLVLDTLVNPQRRVSATEIHGITDHDVADAPTFQEIAGDVVKAFAGTVVAAYNVYFDIRFLSDEFGRVGFREVPPHVCLMYLRPMLGLGRKCGLTDACREHGIDQGEAHTASADAMASAGLWTRYQQAMSEQGIQTFRDLTTLRAYKFMESFGRPPLDERGAAPLEAGRRFKSRSRQTTPHDRLEGVPRSRTAHVHEYWEAVTAAVTDLEVSNEEVGYLAAKRDELGLSLDELRAVHGRVFAGMLARVLEDSAISDTEWVGLRRLHDCLSRLGWAPGS